MNILRGQRQLLSIIKLRKATKLFNNRDSCYLALIVFKTLVFDDITQHLSPLTRYQSILTQWNTCNILIWDEYRRTCIHIIFAKIMYIWRKFATMYMHMYIDRGKTIVFSPHSKDHNVMMYVFEKCWWILINFVMYIRKYWFILEKSRCICNNCIHGNIFLWCSLKVRAIFIQHPGIQDENISAVEAFGNPRWPTSWLGCTEVLDLRLHILWCGRLFYRLEKLTLDKINLKDRKSLMFQSIQAIFWIIFITLLILILVIAQNCIVLNGNTLRSITTFLN